MFNFHLFWMYKERKYIYYIIKNTGVDLMTKIDIFSGFLGAGKTTLIKKLIKEDLPSFGL